MNDKLTTVQHNCVFKKHCSNDLFLLKKIHKEESKILNGLKKIQISDLRR